MVSSVKSSLVSSNSFSNFFLLFSLSFASFSFLFSSFFKSLSSFLFGCRLSKYSTQYRNFSFSLITVSVICDAACLGETLKIPPFCFFMCRLGRQQARWFGGGVGMAADRMRCWGNGDLGWRSLGG